MIAGFTLLALVLLSLRLNAVKANIDIEQTLPCALSNFITTSLLGFFLAGLLAAFKSTFAATVNASPACVVNDISKQYINPKAGKRRSILQRVSHYHS